MRSTSFIVLVLSSVTAISATAQTTSRSARAMPDSAGRIYYAAQVSRGGRLLAGFVPPVYPDSLKKAGIGGTVLAQWVIDTTGTPEMNTFKILRSPNQAFADAVRQTVVGMRFTPAFVNDRKVRELIQTPFQFRAK